MRSCSRQIAAPHLAARIRGRAHHDAARLRRDRLAQCVRVELPVGRHHRHQHRHEAERERHVQVVAVVRLEQDDLVARIEERETRSRESAGRTRGHHDFAHRIEREPVAPLDLLRHRASQRENPFGRGVDHLVLADRIDRARGNGRRCRQIADALTEIDPVHRIARASHRADVGDDQ